MMFSYMPPHYRVLPRHPPHVEKAKDDGFCEANSAAKDTKKHDGYTSGNEGRLR